MTLTPTPTAVTGASGPALMRSASAGHCPDFFDSDIDSIIAQYYVPPPPSSFNDPDSADTQVGGFVMSWSVVLVLRPACSAV